MTMRLNAYRILTRGLSRLMLGKRHAPPMLPAPQGARIWFHGASRGELESLLPVAADAQARGAEVIVTGFSGSLGSAPLWPEALWSGLVRGEGYWSDDLERIVPTQFVTFRYEAWPELWGALAKKHVPLTILGARARRSYRVAAKIVRALGEQQPSICFAPSVASDALHLRAEWPNAQVVEIGDPRWDRVRARAPERDLAENKICVCGSIWPSDVAMLAEGIRVSETQIWLFPHDTTPKGICEIRQALKIHGIVAGREGDASSRVILVERQGILVETYARANSAYVGGGFGRGLHSVLEPAHYGIPILAGPRGISRFPEALAMLQTGQLAIARGPEDFVKFLNDAGRARDPRADEWQDWIAKQFGASRRAAMLLSGDLHGASRSL